MLTLYYDYKRNVVERTHAVTTLPSPSPITPTVPARRDTGLRDQVRGRDGGICRITGVADRKYWEGRQANVGFGVFKGCQVAHGIPLECWPTVLGARSKTLGYIWSRKFCGHS